MDIREMKYIDMIAQTKSMTKIESKTALFAFFITKSPRFRRVKSSPQKGFVHSLL